MSLLTGIPGRRPGRVERMRQILFVQGAGEGAHDAWDEKLVASLRTALGDDYEIRYPRMPSEADPRYDAWSAALRTELEKMEDGAIVVGHSIGGAIFINTVAERPSSRRLGAIILMAAPYIGDGGWPPDGWTPQHPLEAKLPSDVAVYIFHGTRDETVPATHAALYHTDLPRADVRLLNERDHQFNNDLRDVAAVITSLR